MYLSGYTLRRALAIRIGIDMGGTFVDCVVRDGDRVVATGKAPSTPLEPVAGIVAALAAAAGGAGTDLPSLLGTSTEIVHGTTAGLNALLTRSGSRIGLLTTKGHEDAILIGRVHQKVAGLGPEEIIRVSELKRPEPIVPRWRIHGIDERTDRDGTEVTALDEPGVVAAVDALAETGCEAVAISFLWSFRDPAHERRAAAIVRERHPSMQVTLSCEVAPVLGEYERTATTVVNAYLLTAIGAYLEGLENVLTGCGFAGRLSMMTSAGGTVALGLVASRPVETLGSGPVGGVVAAQGVAAALDLPGVIATDMGGTSFDVSLVTEGRAETTDVTIVAQLHLAVPALDVRSIGAGGGSVAWVDDSGGLHVGPRAATPGIGPACYGLGGTEPTVTDADLLLGRIDDGAVLGGRIRLSLEVARRAIGGLAERLGVDPIVAAAGIVRVADAQMADLVRKMSIERGHDPRGLTLLSFGGAGPLHVGGFAPDVGVREAIVPAGAAVFSADGLCLAGWQRTYRRSVLLPSPLEPAAIDEQVRQMEADASADLEASGREGPLTLRRAIDLRYRRQTHHVTVPLPEGPDEASLADTVDRFEQRYEEIHGPGTGYRAAGIEATSIRVIATAPNVGPAEAQLSRRDALAGPAPGPIGHRDVYIERWLTGVPVFDGTGLEHGVTLCGPALVTWPTTTLVVHPGHRADVLRGGHVRVRFDAADA